MMCFKILNNNIFNENKSHNANPHFQEILIKAPFNTHEIHTKRGKFSQFLLKLLRIRTVNRWANEKFIRSFY